MCHPLGSRPPSLPRDLPTMSGGAGGADTILTSADGTRFRAYLAAAPSGDAGVVIAPDVRGLHPFYEQLAERFASAGVHTIAFDYFGRTAGTDRRGDEFEYAPHVRQTTIRTIQADIAASAAHLRQRTGAKRVFVLGFCMGGRTAFIAGAEQTGIAGVIGFYGRLSTREGEAGHAPKDRAAEVKVPVLGLFGGADPGIPESDVGEFGQALDRAGVRRHFEVYPGAPHSFFDRTYDEHRAACDDAWRPRPRIHGERRSGAREMN